MVTVHSLAVCGHENRSHYVKSPLNHLTVGNMPGRSRGFAAISYRMTRKVSMRDIRCTAETLTSSGSLLHYLDDISTSEQKAETLFSRHFDTHKFNVEVWYLITYH